MNDVQSSDELKALKTWSHLATQRKKPSEYDIVSVNTMFNNDRRDWPLEVSPNVPMNQWYRRHRKESRIQHKDWSSFRDPDALVYRAYCAARDKDEIYIDGLLSQYNDDGRDAKIPESWVRKLAETYAPMRFLFHTAQMATAYAVMMAPSSTIANCAAFQAGDQFRWVSRVAYRTAELNKSWPEAGFTRNEREYWQASELWQGFRSMMERLLTTYDWDEELLALNLVVMPAIDSALRFLAASAAAHGDELTHFLVEAQLRDSDRRIRWTDALMKMVLSNDANQKFVVQIVSKWIKAADSAVCDYEKAFI